MGFWNTRGLRGSSLETLINFTNDFYRQKGLALFQKIPTPITPVKVNNEKRIKNQKWNITTDTDKMQRIIMTYFKILYSTKLENLKEMDNFSCYLPPTKIKSRPTNLNRPIAPSEIEAFIFFEKAQSQMDLVQNSNRLSQKS